MRAAPPRWRRSALSELEQGLRVSARQASYAHAIGVSAPVTLTRSQSPGFFHGSSSGITRPVRPIAGWHGGIGRARTAHVRSHRRRSGTRAPCARGSGFCRPRSYRGTVAGRSARDPLRARLGRRRGGPRGFDARVPCAPGTQAGTGAFGNPRISCVARGPRALPRRGKPWYTPSPGAFDMARRGRDAPGLADGSGSRWISTRISTSSPPKRPIWFGRRRPGREQKRIGAIVSRRERAKVPARPRGGEDRRPKFVVERPSEQAGKHVDKVDSPPRRHYPAGHSRRSV
jgi:hypothetical protein